MRIAVDAMGGDRAPGAIVTGALRAARELKDVTRLLLVGREDAVRAELPPEDRWPSSLGIVPASEVIAMDESPAMAVRRKRDASINRMADLARAGEVDAIFSAGNTGAVVAACMLKLRNLEGVLRPAIATVMPTRKTPFVLIDAGANTDSTPAMLRQFAVMGTVYAREILGIGRPLIGLLSIGGEESKGNETTKEALALLRNSPLNVHGNVEGHDLYEGRVDVVVCDGFVGNVVLKTSESVAHFIGEWLRQEFTRNPLRLIGAALLKPALNDIRRKSDPSAYGGAPLLGVNGVCVIGHGASNEVAVYNAIRFACEAVKHRVNPLITAEIERVEKS